MNNLLKIQKTLALLGLNETEVKVYLDLLKLGNTPASQIARRLKLNRSTTRYTLENLTKKRFVFQESRNGTFFFTAEDPEKILLLLKSEQHELDEKQNSLHQIMGDLKNLKNPHFNTPKVRFFQGIDGLIKMYEDILETSRKTKCTLYGYALLDYQKTYPEFLDFIENVYVPEREKIGNKSFFIFNDNESNQKYIKNDKKMNRTTLLVPEEQFPFKTAFHIYDDKISFSSQLTTGAPTGIIMEHKDIQNDHFSLFRMAWEVARKLPGNEKYKDISL